MNFEPDEKIEIEDIEEIGKMILIGTLLFFVLIGAIILMSELISFIAGLF